ncbi:hypothetical protein J5279_28710, partial [Rhizobium sp. B209b/85]|nr:hypothetical protein [Rhizobium sp. B209b/85]
MLLFGVRSIHFRHQYPGLFASYPGGRCSVLNVVFDSHPTVSHSSVPVRSLHLTDIEDFIRERTSKNGFKRLCRSALLGNDLPSSKAQAAGRPICVLPPFAPALGPIGSPTSTPQLRKVDGAVTVVRRQPAASFIRVLIDQNPSAHSLRPMDMIRQGWLSSLRQASQ